MSCAGFRSVSVKTQRGQPEGQKSRCARFRDGCQQEITRNAGPQASQDLTPVVNIYAHAQGNAQRRVDQIIEILHDPIAPNERRSSVRAGQQSGYLAVVIDALANAACPAGQSSQVHHLAVTVEKGMEGAIRGLRRAGHLATVVD